MLTDLFPNLDIEDFWQATYETFYMTFWSLVGTVILGLLLRLLLYLTDKGGIWQNKFINMIVAAVVNVFRAVPFIILIILLIQFTDFLVGTISGPNAALPELIIGFPLFYGSHISICLIGSSPELILVSWTA